jgi:molecular chaperone GrpE (heat shock protein)
VSDPDAPTEVDGESGVDEPGDRFDEIVRRLDELADLFTRRLSDDRARRAAVEELTEQLRRAELGPFRQILHPFVQGVALVIDRLDRYRGPDPDFVASIREELLDVLVRHGVTEVAVEDGFDPAQHEAVELRHEPKEPPGAVLEVRRSGYAHGGWVFRPAHVIVNAENPTADTV